MTIASRSARSARLAWVPKCSKSVPGGSRKSYRGGVRLELTTRTSFPFCRSRPTIPTSDPRASPSGRTCVVTRKRSHEAIRSDSGDQSMLIEGVPAGRAAGQSASLSWRDVPATAIGRSARERDRTDARMIPAATRVPEGGPDP